jgi:hypothetical protein
MFQLHFTFSPLWLVPLVAVAAGLAWWQYRNVQITVGPRVAWVLRGLRFGGLLMLLILLLEPLITALTDTKYPPIVVWLQDGSQSITARGDSTWYQQQYPPAVQQAIARLEAEGVSVQPYVFGSETTALPSIDSLRFDRQGTHIAAALESIRETYAYQNLAAIVLASDGILTAGANPVYTAEGFALPVHAVLMGDTTQPRDLQIESVLYNDISFTNTQTPIRASLRSLGLPATPVTLRLTQGGKTLATRSLTLGGNTDRAEVEFEVTLTQPGLQQFELQLTELEGEVSLRNNRQLVFINVLDTRLRIAIFAGSSHPDVGALTRCFRTDPRYQVSQFVRKNEQAFYETPNLDALAEFDLFIFHNFPAVAADRAVLDRLYETAAQRRTPIWHFVGSQTRFNIHPRQSEFMPLVPDRQQAPASEAILELKPSYLQHSTFPFEAEAFQAWLRTTPPLLRSDADWKPQTGTEVFGTARIKGVSVDYPTFALQTTNEHKRAMLVGENLWRYRLHSYAKTENFDFYDEWIQATAQWLTTREDKRRFRVTPSKPLFSGEEPAILRGQVYDEIYQPLSGAEIKLKLILPNGSLLDHYLTEPQPGAYYLELRNLEAGTYRYEAVGTRNNQPLGTDRGAFSVGQSAVEFLNLQADAERMRQIATRTDGSFATARQLDQTVAAILAQDNLRPLSVIERRTQLLSRLLWPLLLALTLLSLEWVIRKRNGLV